MNAIGVQPNGLILIGGAFLNVNFTARNRIARINAADFTLDNTFNPGSGADDTVLAIGLQSNGQIIVGGEFFFFNGTSTQSIARLNTNGTLDNSFFGAITDGDPIKVLTVQSNDQILVGDGFEFVNGTARNNIARLNSNGTLDASFNPGLALDNDVSAIAVQTNGQIVIGGAPFDISGASRHGLVRLNSNGTLDAPFNPDVQTSTGDVVAMALQTDGKIVLGGLFISVNGTPPQRNCSNQCGWHGRYFV